MGRGDSKKVGLLGEAKSGSEPAGIAVLARLERARDLLATRAAVARDVKLAIFSASGFDRALLGKVRARTDVELVDLERLYTGA